jgi:hypothetical protein
MGRWKKRRSKQKEQTWSLVLFLFLVPCPLSSFPLPLPLSLSLSLSLSFCVDVKNEKFELFSQHILISQLHRHLRSETLPFARLRLCLCQVLARHHRPIFQGDRLHRVQRG